MVYDHSQVQRRTFFHLTQEFDMFCFVLPLLPVLPLPPGQGSAARAGNGEI